MIKIFINELFHFDEAIRNDNNNKLLCGIDEVGRGAFAGPICSVAIILKDSAKHIDFKNSKKMSEKKREGVFDEILNNSIAHYVSFIFPEEIDDFGIDFANRKSINIASKVMRSKFPDCTIVVDGKYFHNNSKYIFEEKGDEKSMAIAAASVVAKVSRDRMMKEMDEIFDGYDFSSNKGYGSKKHIEAIVKNGIIDGVHRISFLKNVAAKNELHFWSQGS